MGPYWFLYVLVGFYAFLGIFIGPNVSLWVL